MGRYARFGNRQSPGANNPNNHLIYTNRREGEFRRVPIGSVSTSSPSSASVSRRGSTASNTSGGGGTDTYKVHVDWYALAMAGSAEQMNAWDFSAVKILQTLQLSKGDVNTVAFGRNFILATGSG